MATVPFPLHVREFVASTSWTFAKTYAATWPHEYVLRTPDNAVTFRALARHIFEHGNDGRFYSHILKYHHEGGKVYWSMDPTPETTDLINRCDEADTYEARLAAGTLPAIWGATSMGRRLTQHLIVRRGGKELGPGVRLIPEPGSVRSPRLPAVSLPPQASGPAGSMHALAP